MSYVRRFRAFPAVVRVGLFLASVTDVVWSPALELLSMFRISTLDDFFDAMHPGTQLFHHFTVPLCFSTGSFDIDYLESIRHVSLILSVFDKNFFP